MTDTLHIASVQLNCFVGDIEGNTQRILKAINALPKNVPVDLVVFPELTLTGYPPEDLLLRPALYARIETALETLKKAITTPAILIGYPEKHGECCYNKAALIADHKILATYSKQALPNYTVFDDQRYFTPGDTPCVLQWRGFSLGLLICEDIWRDQPLENTVAAGADCLLILNASPFDQHKATKRLALLEKQTRKTHCPMLYTNLVGGQDELVFDGGSFAINADGQVAAMSPYFEEHTLICSLNRDHNTVAFAQHSLPETPDPIAQIYAALVLGVRDYVTKNQFPSALIGLSGGIDSALTLAIAVDALGAEKLTGVLLPSAYTTDISNEEATAQAKLLDVRTLTLPIQAIFETTCNTLVSSFASHPIDKTEENLQARIRGMLLMALSNKFGGIVLTTGNKSEFSVGYATLYGDMAGGFAVLKDIPKTLVYQLAHYRNTQSPAIPERVITRAPSAELAANQKDSDTLPPYDILDAIIARYVDQDQSVEQIIAAGFEPDTVKHITRMINRNEYKRRQAPPGPRISERAYGKDRRYPITSGYY